MPVRLLAAALCLATVLSVRVVAVSVVVHDGADFRVRITPAGNVGTTPLKALQVTVDGKDGVLPTLFDSTKSGLPGPFPGITTVGTALHQVWEFSGLVMTPTLDLAGDPTPFPRASDSHFLVDAGHAGDVHPFNPPYEDRVTGSIEDQRAGFGSFLQGTFWLRAGYERPSWDLAYLVVPAGAELRFDFELAGSLGEFDEVSASYRVLRGDLDCSGQVDFDDIGPLVLALTDPAGYRAQFDLDPIVYGDMDRDGDLDFDDIPWFLEALAAPASGPVASVPEPPSRRLLLGGLCALLAWAWPRR
ncbi:MAG: hypothetical protein A2W31_07200 [Planctomycetes bacterium RBG_16_64_10]|nr:MAG: hypothetical protein A2W31_07200 [Planctomycetes bacterium RBG_16_64_10]